MSCRNYYCLVSGLKEFALEADNKGFDARLVIAEIREALSRRDRGYLDLFYMFYDIENLISIRSGNSRLSSLGLFTAEELAEELKHPVRLPAFARRVIEAYLEPEANEHEDIDTNDRFGRSLYAAYYGECARSRCRFLREWSEFDRNLRNLTAALSSRSKGLAVADAVVGTDDVAQTLMRSSAADFGLKGELGYIDQVMAAVADNGNLLEKEHRIDLIKWNMAEELAVFDYFNINGILSYLVKVNLVHRWATLNAARGREMFEKLIESLGGRELIDRAEKEEEQKQE